MKVSGEPMNTKSFKNFNLPQKMCKSPIAMYNKKLQEELKHNFPQPNFKKKPNSSWAGLVTGDVSKETQAQRLEQYLEDPSFVLANETEPEDENRTTMMNKYSKAQRSVGNKLEEM